MSAPTRPGLPVRARLDDVISSWTDGQQTLVIEEPTAVGLAGFQAGDAASLPWVLWEFAGVLIAAGVIAASIAGL